MKLSKRLQMAADLVENGARVADIGTDHAYLPAYLVQNGVCVYAVASDIGKGPLQNAAQTVRENSLEDRITLVLSDGLKNIDLDVIDTIILTGMGGDLISDILSAASGEKLREKKLILQPQSHSEKVRRFLMNNGFEIKEEKICLDSKHIYICLSATYTGREDYPPSYEYYGELLENDSEYVAPFMENIIFHLSKKRDAMLNNVKNNAEAHKLSEIIENIKRKTEERK